MFTGLIEARGCVIENSNQNQASRLVISNPFTELHAGESIAVNGVCLTLLPAFGKELSFDLSPETCALTTLKNLTKGRMVNLERAMHANARFGGHYVSGHVDTTVTLHAVHSVGDYVEMTVGPFYKDERQFLLPKGSITLDGVSLTINCVENDFIKVLLVPHTLTKTTLGQGLNDDRVNVEFDYLTRIIAHQLSLIGHTTTASTNIEVET